MLIGEVAPLAPLLIPLGEVLLWAVFFGLCIGCAYLARAFFGTAAGAVSWIPWAGKILSTSLASVEHKLVSILSGAAASADAKMGAALHQLARVIDWMGEEIDRHANLIELLAGILAGSAGIGLVQKAIADLLRHSKAVEATATRALHTTITVTRTIRVGIGHDVLPRLRAAEHEIGGVIAHDLPGIRAADRAIFRGIDDLRKWVRTHALTAGTLAFTAAVAWALARLGAGWTRCNNWNKIGKHVCGLPTNLIEDLLGLSLAFLAVVDPVVIADAAIASENTINGLVEKIATLHDSAG